MVPVGCSALAGLQVPTTEVSAPRILVHGTEVGVVRPRVNPPVGAATGWRVVLAPDLKEGLGPASRSGAGTGMITWGQLFYSHIC